MMIIDVEVKITVNYRCNFPMSFGGVTKSINFYFPIEMNFHLSVLLRKGEKSNE